MVVSTSFIGCSQPAATKPAAAQPPASRASAAQTAAAPAHVIVPPSLVDQAPREYPGLHNVVAYHENFYSGSLPEGEQGFQTLAAMGVKTIISVDGMVPEVDKAKAVGIRYIHLPIGYNGFDEHRKLELTRAVHDSLVQGPVYIHCHHGKHRSAAAAATITASMGWGTADEEVQRMKVSGTAPAYKGLFACTAAAMPLTLEQIDSVSGDFPDMSLPSSYVQGMIEVDDIMSRLKLVEAAGWTVPADHPDVVPVEEAARMVDVFRALQKTPHAHSSEEKFIASLHDQQDQSQSLEDLLAADQLDKPRLSQEFKAIQNACNVCHTAYRD
ncbi:MAG TPA: hypothetical protein VG711_01785 [Phycisphaerales bacterium]|nr:hypothetical protein [Phycisphaerales bacterium]